MPKAIAPDILRRITKNRKRDLDSFAYGVQLHVMTLGRSLDDLKLRAAADRFKLARDFERSSRTAAKSIPPDLRLVISRAYYAMYYSARAVVFLTFGGDDKEQHNELPKNIPKDFPDHANWINALKNARLERNNADYDPYLPNEHDYKKTADEISMSTRNFLRECKKYLSKKGCRL